MALSTPYQATPWGIPHGEIDICSNRSLHQRRESDGKFKRLDESFPTQQRCIGCSKVLFISH